MLAMTTHGTMVPADFEECGDCGFDHDYEYERAAEWHRDNPCSYCPYINATHATNCPTLRGSTNSLKDK